MAKNGDKPKKLSALDERKKPEFWPGFSRASRRFRPATIAWMVNVITALVLLFILVQPKEKQIQSVYYQPAGSDYWVADRDFELPADVEGVPVFRTIKIETDAALDQTRSIYDYVPAVHEDNKRVVRRFFSDFRLLYPPPPPPPPELDGDTVEERPGVPLEAAVPGPAPTVMRPASPAADPKDEQRLLSLLPEPLSEEDLALLKDNHFSPELEQAILELLDAVYTGRAGAPVYVVSSKDRIKKEKRGIVAHTVTAQAPPPPRNIDNLDSIQDLDSARGLALERAEEQLKDLKPELRQVAAQIAVMLIEPNLHFNKNKTEEVKNELRAAIGERYKTTFRKGEVIVRRGQRIEDPYQIQTIDFILSRLHDQYVLPQFERVGFLLLLLLFFAAMVTFGQINIKKFRLESRDLIFLSSILLLFLLALKGIELLSHNAPKGGGGHHQFVNYFYLLPLAGAVMLVRMVKNSEIALAFAVVIAVLGGMVAQQNIYFVVYTLIGSVIGAQEVRQCRQRSTILRAGLILGVVNVLLILTISLINHQFLNQKALLLNSLFGFAGGILVAIFVAGLAPLAEWVLGYATDIKLLELLNQDHPVLKDLSMRAPGTHQHSLMVANLSEEAAKAIGANPLLARVTAMYHDIGKMNKPPYYAENQWDGTNVHDQLSPSMSTLIIHSHVKEGVDLARKHKLPWMVVESIRQHHGTSLVQFFYERAKELNDTGVPVNEVDYRYHGPKPQTREAAIIMLADVVESAARSIREPDPARLQGMVQKLINRFFIDGQLDECDLTLKDLHMIARSFNKTLGAIYHHRPDYPLPAAKGTPAEKRKKADQDAAKPKDDGTRKEKNKGPDDQDEDKDQNENYLKRLGM